MARSTTTSLPLLGACCIALTSFNAGAESASPPPQPAAAAAAEPAPAEAAMPETPPAEAMPPQEPIFTLRLRQGDVPAEDIPVFEQDPFGPLLKLIRKGAELADARPIKPAQVTQEIAWVLPEEPTRVLGEIPPLRILSTALWGGGGKSKIEMAPFQRKIDDNGDTGTLDWKGIVGELSYKDPALTAAAGQFKAPGLHVVADGEGEFNLRDLSLAFDLDADALPRKVDFKLPEMRLNSNEDGNFLLSDMSVKGEVHEARPGLDLGEGAFRIKGFTFERGEEKVEMKGLEIGAESKLQGERVSYTVGLGVERLAVSAAVNPAGADEFRFHSNLAFEGLDAGAVAELQKTMREIQLQQRAGTLSDEMLGMVIMGKMMELMPRLWQASPQIAWRDVHFSSSHGEVSGNLVLKVDGSKKLDPSNPAFLQSAVSGEADVTLSRSLLAEAFEAQVRTQYASLGDMGDDMGDMDGMDDMSGMDGMDGMDGQEPPVDEEAMAGMGGDESTGADDAVPEAEGMGEAPAMPSDEEIAQMVESQIQGLVAANWLKPAEGDRYKLTARFAGGKLIVNGTEIPLPFGPPAP